jgi:hypothetical protein
MAAAAAAAAAGRLLAPAAELRCEATLACGQIFGWRALAPTRWAGVLRDRVVTIEEVGCALCCSAPSLARVLTQLCAAPRRRRTRRATPCIQRRRWGVRKRRRCTQL